MPWEAVNRGDAQGRSHAPDRGNPAVPWCRGHGREATGVRPPAAILGFGGAVGERAERAGSSPYWGAATCQGKVLSPVPRCSAPSFPLQGHDPAVGRRHGAAGAGGEGEEPRHGGRWGAPCAPAYTPAPPRLFQGENLLYCFEVVPAQPTLTQGKQDEPHAGLSQPPASPPPHGCPVRPQSPSA